MMYLLFNEYGAIKDKQINEWIVQGSNNVNKIGVAIDGVNPTSFALVGICKLPNGEIITTAPVDEQAEIIDGVYGVVFSLSKDITALEGTLRINIQAINTITDKIITSYTVFLCVNEGVDPGEIVMMTADQYQDLLSKIELDVQQDETILKVANRTALGSISQWQNGQLFLCLSDSSYNNHKTLLHLNKLNPLYPYELIFDFNDHYTKGEVDTMLNAKQDKLTVESLDTAQLQYAVGFDENGNLKKGAGGGGGAIYTAGYGISISDFQISVDTTQIATKLELNAVAEIADGKNKGYVINTQSQITGTKDSDDNYTGVTAITGVVLTDLHIGDIIYIKELNVPDYWVSALVYSGDTLQSVSLNKMETSKVDLTDYVDLDSAQTITGVKTFNADILGTFWKIENNSNYFGVRRRDGNAYMWYADAANFNVRNLLPIATETQTLGSSSQKWKDGYFSGQVYAQNTFNVINASDIVSNILTQEQYNLITNGKPTLIIGLLTDYDNFIVNTIDDGTYIRFNSICISQYSETKIKAGYINKSTRVISFVGGGIIVNNTGRVDFSILGYVNGKQFPAYPTTNASPQVLTIAAHGGNLSWEYLSAITGLDIPFLQATTSIAHSATLTMNNVDLTTQGYSATDTTISSYAVIQIKYNNANCDETQAKAYMKKMTGSEYLPTYNINSPNTTLLIFDNGKIYKAQYDSTNGLVLWYVNSMPMNYILPEPVSGIVLTQAEFNAIHDGNPHYFSSWGGKYSVFVLPNSYLADQSGYYYFTLYYYDLDSVIHLEKLKVKSSDLTYTFEPFNPTYRHHINVSGTTTNGNSAYVSFDIYSKSNTQINTVNKLIGVMVDVKKQTVSGTLAGTNVIGNAIEIEYGGGQTDSFSIIFDEITFNTAGTSGAYISITNNNDYLMASTTIQSNINYVSDYVTMVK